MDAPLNFEDAGDMWEGEDTDYERSNSLKLIAFFPKE